MVPGASLVHAIYYPRPSNRILECPAFGILRHLGHGRRVQGVNPLLHGVLRHCPSAAIIQTHSSIRTETHSQSKEILTGLCRFFNILLTQVLDGKNIKLGADLQVIKYVIMSLHLNSL